MLTKPAIQEKRIKAVLKADYGLQVAELAFLPLGVDINTAIYHDLTKQGVSLFVKLRKDGFDPVAVDVPAWLAAQGIAPVMAPLQTRAGRYWAALDDYRLILYPFIAGQDAHELPLSDGQWQHFGAALRAIHDAQLPQELKRRIPRETYSPRWREAVKTFQTQVQETSFDEPTAVKLASFMKDTREEITHLVERAAKLALELRRRELDFVLCHANIHPGNLLVGADAAFYIVDWDNPIYAPKERDLGLVGGGSVWNNARQNRLFYQGYGPAEIDRSALAYYRYERIIQDIAAFCEQLLLSDAGGPDREQGYAFFSSNFLPGHEVELANKTDE